MMGEGAGMTYRRVPAARTGSRSNGLHIVALPSVVLAGGGGVLWYEYVEGVLDYGEVLWGLRHYFPVYVDGHFGVCFDADAGGSEVMYALHLDEVSAPEVSGDPE